MDEHFASNSGRNCEDNFEFFPKRFWNLDPVHRTYAKLYIGDILKLEDYPRDRGAFAYKNHPVYKVDVLGWVVMVDERSRMFHYGVDDGTGVIDCCCWKPKMFAGERERTACSGQAGSLSDIVWGHVQDHDIHQATCRELGDILHVRGIVKRYHSRLEVSASYYRKIEDPACKAQIYRMEELPHLYQNLYDRPFVLPSHIGRKRQIEALEEKSGKKTKVHLIDVMCGFLKNKLSSLRYSNFSLCDLETVDGVMDIATRPCLDYQNTRSSTASAQQIRSIIKSAVLELEREGFLYHGSGLDEYRVVRRGEPSKLDQIVLSILKTECQRTKYEEGCHFLHIVDKLRENYHFENLSADSVKQAMSRLEENSDVISVTSKKYLPVN